MCRMGRDHMRKLVYMTIWLILGGAQDVTVTIDGVA
jgi:hypothetical protein